MSKSPRNDNNPVGLATIQDKVLVWYLETALQRWQKSVAGNYRDIKRSIFGWISESACDINELLEGPSGPCDKFKILLYKLELYRYWWLGQLETKTSYMGNMGRRFSKWKRMVRQQKGKLYIMRVCITMLLCWHKYS